MIFQADFSNSLLQDINHDSFAMQFLYIFAHFRALHDIYFKNLQLNGKVMSKAECFVFKPRKVLVGVLFVTF